MSVYKVSQSFARSDLFEENPSLKYTDNVEWDYQTIYKYLNNFILKKKTPVFSFSFFSGTVLGIWNGLRL